MRKKFLKIIFYPTGGLITIALLYFGSAFILSRITISEEPNTADDLSIYILSNGIHTDIVVPVKSDYFDWSNEINYEHIFSKDSTMNYLGLGWGDREFYLKTPEWSDLKFSVGFKAVFGLGNTAIHATFYKTIKENETCKKISISALQYKRLVHYIINSFDRNLNGQVIQIKTNATYGINDAFYEANGSFNLFYTCNTWTNSALKTSGQKACLWTAFDTGILLKHNID